MGVTFYPDDGVDADVLLRHADGHVPGQSRPDAIATTCSIWRRMWRCAPATKAWRGVRRALEQGELVLHYQPKVHMRSGVVVGARR